MGKRRKPRGMDFDRRKKKEALVEVIEVIEVEDEKEEDGD